MQEKHLISKEIDITRVLVGIFIVMIASLIVSVSNSFLQTKTSADTKAKVTKLKTIIPNGAKLAPQAMGPLPNKTGEGGAYCRSTQPLGLDGNAYSASGDFCLAEGHGVVVDKSDSKVKCTSLGVVGFTCQRNGDLSTIGSNRCVNITRINNAVCRLGLSCNSGETEFAACGLKNGSEIQQGTCCAVPPTPTPIPIAVPYVSGLMISDCSSSHINCAAMFGYNSDGSLSKITNGTQSPESRNTKKDLVAFSKISCGTSNSVDINDSKMGVMRCVFPLGSSDNCDAYQFAFNNNSCYVSAKAVTTSGTYYNGATNTWEKGKRLCIINTVSGANSWTKCKDKSNSLSN
ncbi:MAG: hypothetical protein NTZ55_04530 [Candidatus Roizmanbacteria bacterium]|nr:hypothetical protein [Candidatus Roizmanbacteria bacterium]